MTYISKRTDFSITKDPRIENISGTWFNSTWRPLMSYVYMSIIVFDFMLAPVLFFALSGILGIEYKAWDPLTLRGSGLIHVVFGAVLGIYAHGRTKEKLTNLADLRNEFRNENIDKNSTEQEN